ncbi:MAG: hypothetical protein IPK28_06880 [Devosia sp.]|nr:hypothetical protein [Devosia sp.]
MQPKLIDALPTTLLLGHADGGPMAAAPPYHVRTTDFMFVLATFDPDAARRSLPKSLSPVLGEPGFMGLYSARTGWGITPYAAFFVAIPVVGFDSPDGSRGYLMVEGFYSGRAGPVMHSDYNRRLGPGSVRQWDDGRVWHGEVGDPDEPIVTLSVTPVLPRPATPLTAGVHHYLGEREDGGLNIYSVAYSGIFYPVDDVVIDIHPRASLLLQSLRPTAIPYAALIPEVPLTFSPPRPVSTPAVEIALQSARMSLLDLLSRLGRAAALISETGRLIFVNAEGEELLRGAIRSGRFEAWNPEGRVELRHAIAAAVRSGPGAIAEPIALDRPDRGYVLLVQAIPVSATLAGEPAALLLFSDPTRPARSDPSATLELLGLTRAEARLASEDGSGLSAKQAATQLGITPNTARSTLQVVYDKLGIGKQSELARIVARLEVFGGPTGGTP